MVRAQPGREALLAAQTGPYLFGRVSEPRPLVPAIGVTIPPSKGRVPHVRRLEARICPVYRPAKGVLIVFCEEGLKFGSAARKVLAADRRSGDAGGGGRAASRARTGRRSTFWRRRASTCRAWSLSASARRATSRRRTSSSSAASPWAKFRRRPPRRRSLPTCRAARSSRSGRPTSRSACGCAPMRSTATRPSARRTRSAPRR